MTFLTNFKECETLIFQIGLFTRWNHWFAFRPKMLLLDVWLFFVFTDVTTALPKFLGFVITRAWTVSVFSVIGSVTVFKFRLRFGYGLLTEKIFGFRLTELIFIKGVAKEFFRRRPLYHVCRGPSWDPKPIFSPFSSFRTFLHSL